MSKRSHPEDISTNEPSPKKQTITPEMYKKREVKIAELEKRNIEAQEMTQKQIEKFQDRTAKAEEKLSKIEKYYKLIDNNEEKKAISENKLRLLRTDYKKIGGNNRLDHIICNEIEQSKTKIRAYHNSVKLLLNPLPPQVPIFGDSRCGGRGTATPRGASAAASATAPATTAPAAFVFGLASDTNPSFGSIS